MLRCAQDRTTSGIALELGIGLACVSQHTRTLRESGLLTGSRSGKHVQPTRTALKVALYQQPEPPAGPAAPAAAS